jgi:Ser-tRNA(Ala) deacylase AlaX
MNNLLIEKTNSTPNINFNYDMRKLIISGESFPENAAKFYEPVITWIKEYLGCTGEEETEVEFEIIYFNSSTSKIFMNIFSLLDEEVQEGKNIIINWIASEDNEAAIECGEEFKEDLEDIEFNIIIK